MDHADSVLFHTLEDTVRVQNARALGIFKDVEAASSHGEQQQSIDGDTLGANMLPLPPQPPDSGVNASDGNAQHRITGTGT